VKDAVMEGSFSMMAAAVAFYAFLALVPTLIALTSIYGLLQNPAEVEAQIDALGGVLPVEVQQLLREQLTSIAARSGAALSVGAIIGFLVALWSAAVGTKGLMEALNTAYGEPERRGFIHRSILALLLTLGGIVLAVLAILSVVVAPAVFAIVGLDEGFGWVLAWLRWPVLGIAVILALAVLYRYGPSRERAKWRWVTWGSVLATALWLAGSALFSLYVSRFADYNETYGSLGAIVILLLWFWVGALAVMLGGTLNAEMEHQTARDTTTGRPQPMGKRGAYVADTLGRTP
jgi:membrane protein